MGIEPTNFRTLVGCSNHWATKTSVVSRSIVGWHNYRIAQSFFVKTQFWIYADILNFLIPTTKQSTFS